ncbi:FMN reductase [Agrococcus casei]|uniref:FMN reductase n=1 Tax=Agrococcus casei LMG 22410 TaxID=1255656 RepID=A0A1R4F1G1_9MICO|nr:FMN reductase [Agrococcus casei]SJM49701.1 FMN reductase [Agrococcus casei LMG 22410]
MPHYSLAVIAAGLSEPSSTRMLADRLAEGTAKALESKGHTVTVKVVELREFAADIANVMVTQVETDAVKQAVADVTGADGIIAVSPTFTMSYSGLFKSFIDIIDNDALVNIPVLLGATGGSIRHSMVLDTAMRPLFAYLKGHVIPTGVYAASEDWGNDSGLQSRVDRAGAELADTMILMPHQRKSDPFDPTGSDFESFETLLGS